MTDDQAAALADLEKLVSHGPRFHGSAEIAAASRWLESRLTAAGLTVNRQPVRLPGWLPGATNTVRVLTPHERELPTWPMLWSGASQGPTRGRLLPLGPQGIWGDSITWQRFTVVAATGEVIAYLHGRDVGPAAPQPLPSGSDHSVPHLAVGHLDGLQLAEWLDEGKSVEVEIEGASAPAPEAVSDNLIADIAGTGAGLVLACAHYDTFYNTVGAYDNGSGTIALLHLAEKWATQPPPRSVRLIFFTAEEWHLGGSRHYVGTAAQADLDAIDYVVNIDGLGRGSFAETFAAPEELGTRFHEVLLRYAEQSGRALRTQARFPPPTGTDDASFYRAGVPSLYLTFNDLHRLHQPDDLPDERIARNIAWTTGLVQHVVTTLPRPRRSAAPGIL